MTSKKLRLALLFGGRSSEHEVSVMSARSIVAALNPDRYEIHCVRIDADGRWQLNEAAAAELGCSTASIGPGECEMESLALPDPSRELLRKGNGAGLGGTPQTFDVIFPVIHGTYGEDGTLQGLLEMAGVPYVGSGVLGSAIGMDKDVAKRLLRDAGIPVVDYLVVRAHEAAANDLGDRVEPRSDSVLREAHEPGILCWCPQGQEPGRSRWGGSGRATLRSQGTSGTSD